ncbi:MAG: hypothetical protein JKY37_08920, partial [Nannocystaceae bacterium]|nr:hypothetical protein [Nannocystaceae bacterium]
MPISSTARCWGWPLAYVILSVACQPVGPRATPSVPDEPVPALEQGNEPRAITRFSNAGTRYAAITEDGRVLAWDLEGNPSRYVARALPFVPPSSALVTTQGDITALTRDGRLLVVDDAMRSAKELSIPAGVTSFMRICSAKFSDYCVVATGELRCAPPCHDGKPFERSPRLSHVRRVCAGETFACAVLETGAVHCWGENDLGQLGANAVRRSERPRRVHGLSDVVDLALGQAHGCALDTAGRVHCWGDTTHGQT